MWPGNQQYVARVVYPFTMVLPGTFRYGDKCRQQLGGEEARVLEFWPQGMLPEPMPVGCRYQVLARQPEKTTFRLAGSPREIQFLSPVKLDPPARATNALGRYVLAVPADGTPAASGRRRVPASGTGASAALTAKRQDRQLAISATVPQGARARLSVLIPQGGLDGRFIVDGQPATTDVPQIRLSDAGKRDKGTRAGFGKQSLFGVDLGGGQHDVRFEALLDRKPATLPSKPAQVVLECFEDRPADVTIEVRHAPIERKALPMLPQNWVWQVRTSTKTAVP
jgi:hypothetical protein